MSLIVSVAYDESRNDANYIVLLLVSVAISLMLSVIILNAIILSVTAPFFWCIPTIVYIFSKSQGAPLLQQSPFYSNDNILASLSRIHTDDHNLEFFSVRILIKQWWKKFLKPPICFERPS